MNSKQRFDEALWHLKVGGYFIHQMEINNMGYESFRTRLISWSGEKVAGIGVATRYALMDAGLCTKKGNKYVASDWSYF